MLDMVSVNRRRPVWRLQPYRVKKSTADVEGEKPNITSGVPCLSLQIYSVGLRSSFAITSMLLRSEGRPVTTRSSKKKA